MGEGDRTRNNGMRSLHRYALFTNQSSFSSLSAVLSRGRPVSRKTSRVRRDNRRCSPSATAAFSDAVVARRSDARVDASRRISCIRARAAGVLDPYRDARGRSSLRHSRGSTPDTCHETGSTLPACTSGRPVTFSCFFFILPRSVLKWSNCYIKKKRKKRNVKFNWRESSSMMTRGNTIRN